MKTIICVIFSLSTFLSTMQLKAQEMSSTINDKGQIAQRMPNIWDVFKTHRSVRALKSDSIPEADIIKIIDAARMAPTAGNQQPWKFPVVRDKNNINRMMEKCIAENLLRYDPANQQKMTKKEYERLVVSLPNRMRNYFSEPVYIVVLTDNNFIYPDYNHWDGSFYSKSIANLPWRIS